MDWIFLQIKKATFFLGFLSCLVFSLWCVCFSSWISSWRVSSVVWLWPISCSWWPLSDGNFESTYSVLKGKTHSPRIHAHPLVCLWPFLGCVAAACFFVFCFNVQLFQSEKKQIWFEKLHGNFHFTHCYHRKKQQYYCCCILETSFFLKQPGCLQPISRPTTWIGMKRWLRSRWWMAKVDPNDHRINMNRMFKWEILMFSGI